MPVREIFTKSILHLWYEFVVRRLFQNWNRGRSRNFYFFFYLTLQNYPQQIPQAKNFILVPNLRIVAIYEGIWQGQRDLNWSIFWNRWSHLYSKACCCRVKCIMSIFRFFFSILGFWAIGLKYTIIVRKSPKLIEKIKKTFDGCFSSLFISKADDYMRLWQSL